MAPGPRPFQLLEINIISAQDLQPVSKKMRTYARAWVNPTRKLSSCVDTEGHNNPSWNDKFVFKVDEQFLREDTSAVMIEIYATHWFRHVIVGTVRVLVGNLIPPAVMSLRQGHIGMRFVALQVRRPSGRPQGILNIGVALLDGSMRSMPLYRQMSASAVGFRDLMQAPPPLKHGDKNNDNHHNNNNLKPILLRSKSERSALFDNYSPRSSVVAVPQFGGKDGSILSISESVGPFKGMIKRKGKASSVINGAELVGKTRDTGKKGKASSVVSDSVYSKGSSSFYKTEKLEKEDKNKKGGDKKLGTTDDQVPTNKVVDEKSVKVVQNVAKPPIPTIGKPIQKHNGHASGAQPYKANSIWSDSEVGPSPSEVAAAIMAERRYPLDDNQSSVLDGWSLDESVEGLRSKLERWRMELPPLYDNRTSTGSFRSSTQRSHSRRRKDGGSGLFSCFGNICGYECQCVCGKPPGRRNHRNRFNNGSSSVGTSGRFI